MKKNLVHSILLLFVALSVQAQMTPATEHTTIKIPKISDDYINIYQPTGDIFPGPSEGELIAEKYYKEWVPNDHCFVQDKSGNWHLFGITHPKTSLDNVHQGENLSFHAAAPQGLFKNNLKKGTWKDLPKVLPPADRPGAPPANHAPFIIERNDLYYMVYGPTPIRYATSQDLMEWTPKGAFGNAPEGRDPNILFWDNTYYLIICGVHDVRVATSLDFKNWQQHDPILTMPEGMDPESPSLIRYNDTFYLFVCGWNGVWDRKELQGAYQHVTLVFQSDNPLKFNTADQITTLDAHAPEIFRDEQGNWFISSVEWPYRGVSVAPLIWE